MAHTWHYGEPEDGILRVRIEREGEPVNSFARESLLELGELVKHIKGNSDIKGVVFRSGKTGNFVAGADINQLRNLNEREAARDISRVGQEVFQALEELDVPTVALIVDHVSVAVWNSSCRAVTAWPTPVQKPYWDCRKSNWG
jgi:enoyl-CoA hydratase/carnithine racemase